MYKVLIPLLTLFISCSKKEVKHSIIEELESTTYFLLKERISKEEVTEIANEFISKKENKNKLSICFFLNQKKNETAFAIAYFSNSKIYRVIYNHDEKKYNHFFNMKFKEHIINHWECKNSSTPFQSIIFKKDNELFYKFLALNIHSDSLYYEYTKPLINIDTLENNEIRFQLKNNDSLRYFLIDKDRNLNFFYENRLYDIVYPKK